VFIRGDTISNWDESMDASDRVGDTDRGPPCSRFSCDPSEEETEGARRAPKPLPPPSGLSGLDSAGPSPEKLDAPLPFRPGSWRPFGPRSYVQRCSVS